MNADDRVRVEHMIDACEAVGQFISGRERGSLETDRMLLFAVLRAIEILGEAAGKVGEPTRAAGTGIPWRAIIGMRNRLVHAYFDVDTEVVWVAATEEIPALIPHLRSLVEKLRTD